MSGSGPPLNLAPADAPEMYTLIVFLGYLTFVTFVIIRHGMAVLRHKGRPQALRTPSHVILAWGCVAASAAVIARLFDIGLDGWVAIVPWVAPTIVGVPAIALWTRHYRRKFSREPGRTLSPGSGNAFEVQRARADR